MDAESVVSGVDLVIGNVSGLSLLPAFYLFRDCPFYLGGGSLIEAPSQTYQ